MKIGTAKAVITPALDRPVYLAGFGQNRRAESIHDPLYACALAVSNGQTTLVLCALDLIGFFRPDVTEVLAALKSTETFQRMTPEVIIAATHTHHGPDTMGLWGPDSKTRGVDAAWMSAAKGKIAETILASLDHLQPAESMRTTSVHVPGVAKNVRSPEIVDDELTLAQFVSAEGKPLATLFNFPCHPEVLWEHNPHITSDYVGFLREAVEKQSSAPCIFFSGALGGMMTPDVQDHSFVEAEAMGNALADAGLSALAKAESTGGDGSYVLLVEKKEISARLTNPLYKLAFWRKLLPDVRDQKGRVTSEVNLIQMGGLWLATVPGELLPILGMTLKSDLIRAGACAAGVIGLANDELGYILPVEDFKYPWNPFNPGKNYEETNSIGKEIAPKVMKGLEWLIQQK